MTEAEFCRYAAQEGFDEPQQRSLPADKFFDTHAHDRDLVVLIKQGTFTVGYAEESLTFSPGQMCSVAIGVEHTDTAGPKGASYVLAWR